MGNHKVGVLLFSKYFTAVPLPGTKNPKIMPFVYYAQIIVARFVQFANRESVAKL
jgi:hypothetical protein